MKNNILLMVSYRQLSKLKPKHAKRLVKLGFIPHHFFDPVFFKEFKTLNTPSHLKIKSYIYSNNKLNKNLKKELKTLLMNLYNNGIYPLELKKEFIYILENDKILLFINDGLESSNFNSKSTITKDYISKVIDKFIKEL